MGNTTGSDPVALPQGSIGTAGLLVGRLCQKHPCPGASPGLLPSFHSQFWPNACPVASQPFSWGACFNHWLHRNANRVTPVLRWPMVTPWFPRRRTVVLPAALCHYEALPRISSDYGWNFLRSPELFLESNYSSKLLIHVSSSWSRNKSIWLNIFLQQSTKTFFQRSGCVAGV